MQGQLWAGVANGHAGQELLRDLDDILGGGGRAGGIRPRPGWSRAGLPAVEPFHGPAASGQPLASWNPGSHICKTGGILDAPQLNLHSSRSPLDPRAPSGGFLLFPRRNASSHQRAGPCLQGPCLHVPMLLTQLQLLPGGLPGPLPASRLYHISPCAVSLTRASAPTGADPPLHMAPQHLSNGCLTLDSHKGQAGRPNGHMSLGLAWGFN